MGVRAMKCLGTCFGLLTQVFVTCFAVLTMPLMAAPKAAALDEAREAVHSLLAEDFSKLNAGRCTLVDVADHVAELASASNSPAMSRVLQEGAFNIYRKAGELQRAAERRVPFWIKLGTDAEFEFAACPAGSFMMGCNDNPKSEGFRHKVKITRPFWMARYQTTKRLYDMFRKVQWMLDEEKLYGGMDTPIGGIPRGRIEEFCEFLTSQNVRCIPDGYVFRLPTDAEWEYALNANCEDAEDPYVRFRLGDQSVIDEISVTLTSVNDFRKSRGLDPVSGKSWIGPVFAVGKRRPNSWGIYDMLGNGREFVLDTIPRGKIDLSYGEGVIGQSHDFGWQSEETDPVRCSAETNRLFMLRGGPRWGRFNAGWYSRVVRPGTYSDYVRQLVFRIVLAPDVLAEREKKGGGE